MNSKNINKNLTINILIGIFILTTYTFGLFVPITSDAGKYAAISRVMFESGDWMNLRIHFEPYLQKPPLLFWITTPFYFLFGSSVFAFKLPVLLFSGIAIYSTYRFTKIYYSKQTAKLAALILATCEFYFLFHNDIHTDSLLTANVIFAVWQLAEYFKSKKLIHIILASTGVGLAMISKGPIGIFVPCTATLFHLFFHKRLKQLINYKSIIGLLTLFAILFIGLKGTYNQFGWSGIRFFFWDNNAGRITGSLKGSSIDGLFYFHTALYIFLPWGFLFFIAFFHEIKNRFKQKWIPNNNDEFFTLGGIIFYWVIISFAKAKAPHYLMVLSPFMAILSAKWLIPFFTEITFNRTKKTVAIVQYAVIYIIWLLLFTLCILCFPTKNIIFWIAILILLSLSIIKINSSPLKRLITRSILAIVAINLSFNALIFPEIFTYQSTISACNIFNEQAKNKEMLNSYLSQHRELFFYAKNPGYYLYDSDDLQKRLLHTGDWIYTNDEGLAEIKDTGVDFNLIKSFKHRSVSKLSINFINPSTRNHSLKNMHLIKLTPSTQN